MLMLARRQGPVVTLFITFVTIRISDQTWTQDRTSDIHARTEGQVGQMYGFTHFLTKYLSIVTFHYSRQSKQSFIVLDFES